MPRQGSRHHPAAASERSRAAWRLSLFLLSGLAFAAAPPPALLAQEAPQSASHVRHPVAAHVSEAALRFGLPEPWIRAVLQAESGGDPAAVSAAGAMGLMQLMPATWADLRARHRLGGDPFDPRDNILAGTAYLRELFDRYGNTGAMLAAYNAGPARYEDYLAGTRDLPVETRAYVAALAPRLAGKPLPPRSAGVPAHPADWREAMLFVGPSADTDRAPPMQDESSAAVTPDPLPFPANPLTPASAGALFVQRTTRGEAP